MGRIKANEEARKIGTFPPAIVYRVCANERGGPYFVLYEDRLGNERNRETLIKQKVHLLGHAPALNVRAGEERTSSHDGHLM